ncbi:hypothetical protein DV736_g6342, partial [Chaetothyriales sp. CBS 134916]
MSEEIVLYDIPSRDPNKSWSLNPWKSRLALNYKGVPYKTQWVEYPDIAPTLKALGVKPNPEGSFADYTSPAVKLPSGQAIQDSWPIAHELERLYPDPSLHLDSPYIQKVIDIITDIAGAIRPIYFAAVPRKLLNPSSAAYFILTREERIGIDLSTYEEKEGGQKAWENAAPHFGRIVALLQEHPEGPFFEGATVTYADFIFVGLLRFLERLDLLWQALDVCEAGKAGGRKSAEDVYFAQHPSELETSIANALYELETHVPDLKASLRPLQFVSARELEVGHGKRAIVLFVPVPLLPGFHKIQQRLTRELEKKFSDRHVLILASRRILPRPKRSNRSRTSQTQKRPRSRTLTAVHDAILADVVYPVEIVGKRLRTKEDGSRVLKVILDEKERGGVDYRLDTYAEVYRKLTGRVCGFEFPVSGTVDY